MGRLAEGGAAVGQDDGVEIAHMRVAHGRGDAAIGHDAAEDQRPNAGAGQHPFHAALIKRRERHLFDLQVTRLQVGDQLMAEASGSEIAASQERPQIFEMGRHEGFAVAAGHQGEMRRHDPAARRAHRFRQFSVARRQSGDGRRGFAGPAIGAVGMDKIVLHVDDDKGGGRGRRQQGHGCQSNAVIVTSPRAPGRAPADAWK